MYESLRKLREKRESGEGGFTLVELLIVIVILGILAAIVVLAIGGLASKSKTSACSAEIKTIRTAEDAFYAQSTDADGNNSKYGAAADIYNNDPTSSLLKDDPAPHWTIAVTGATSQGYTLTGKGNCAGIGFTGPNGPTTGL
ncbi:MAG: prepilin-type N-terminal cleavage/methylation domain-containing protein [Pseudonocardia sp.]|nr:prepilin-type N-terminal cleavage/methylation domain-containing protein [Pseudonocardia sp.]